MYIDTAPSCGYIWCTYLQVDFHKVNARLQLLMKMTPEGETKHAVNKKALKLQGLFDQFPVEISAYFLFLWVLAPCHKRNKGDNLWVFC